jgi:DNA-binding NtrC family response regulator/pSer/pThr/pTyr-binding forkhead associated (FHA) protein
MVNPRLRIESGSLRGREFELTHAFVIGRAESCDLVLADESCSRVHARITPEGDRVRVEDLGSTNGTLLNGEKVRTGFLEDGDRVTIGDTAIVLHRASFDGTKTVILSGAARDTANVVAELALDEAPSKGQRVVEAERRLAAVEQVLEATGGAPEAHAIGRACCAAIAGLLETSRVCLLMFRAGSADPRDAIQVAVPDMRLDPARPWLTRALSKKKIVLLEDRGKTAKSTLHGMVVPLLDGERPALLLYADRRGEAFDAATAAPALRLLKVANALLQTAALHERVRSELMEYRSRTDAERRVVGQSALHRQTATAVRNHAQKPEQAVLFIGESGTGKELLAHVLHDASPRREGAFLAINCAAATSEQLEIELFGAMNGIGGPHEGRPALERASGGTLFLDAIDALDLATQARLAAALRSRRLHQEPSGRDVMLDVRLVAASDRDLPILAEGGAFHEELLALLALATVKVPALRDRVDDIPLLADHFLKHHARRLNRDVKRIAPDALRLLSAYRWPGNVRELSNVVERAVILCRDDELGADLLPFDPDEAITEQELSIEHVEKLAIIRALAYCHGRKGQAARVLGISWPTLNKKIHDYGIEVPEKT